MCENIGKLTELLSRINCELNGFERLLIGEKPEEKCECEEVRDNCVMDTVTRNIRSAEYAIKTLERIDMIFKGGNK